MLTKIADKIKNEDGNTTKRKKVKPKNELSGPSLRDKYKDCSIMEIDHQSNSYKSKQLLIIVSYIVVNKDKEIYELKEETKQKFR